MRLPAILSVTLLPSFMVLANGQPPIHTQTVPIIQIKQDQFRDLNRNGKLDPYEDWRITPLERAQDLVQRMTLAEKVGAMMHASAPSVQSALGVGTHYDLKKLAYMIQHKHINTMITRLKGNDPALLAKQNNALQTLAEQTRLGIPVTISTDPRNAYHYATHQDIDSSAAGRFSKWPQFIGFGAINDPQLTRQYGNMIRQEYRAVGITEALSPQADMASEPRWPRINGTFGANSRTVHDMVESYIEGIQAGPDGLNRHSVISVVKHWVGYGAAKNGWDSHNYYGRFANFQDNNLKTHIYPFTGAFSAHVASVMPTYSILQGIKVNGRSIEQVGAGFSHYLLTELLRHRYHFNGVILSDWLITSDCKATCRYGETANHPMKANDLGMSWGVSQLTPTQRFAKAINAGVDQFGGVDTPQPIIKALKDKLISIKKINQAVIKIMEQKFAIGLFESPFVKPDQAKKVLKQSSHQHLANQAQARALVLLKNSLHLLPLKKGSKVYLYHIQADIARKQGLIVVDSPNLADVAIMRIEAPFRHPHNHYFFGARQHEGSLDYSNHNPEFRALLKISQHCPTIVSVYLDRPAILTKIEHLANTLIGNFGVSDKVLLESLSGKHHFTGKLPFEMPASMQAVRQQHSDRPHDSLHPLYPIGYGLSL